MSSTPAGWRQREHFPIDDWVALGRCRPRAPTDPYVLALEHTVPQIMGSLRVVTHPKSEKRSQMAMNAICGDCFSNAAIRSCFVDTMVEFRCIRRVSQEGSMIRRLASLPWLRPGAVRQLRRYYQGAMTSCRPSRRTSLPSLGGTSAFTRSFRSPADECTAEARSWSPGAPAGTSLRKRQDLPSSWGTPSVRLPCSVDAGRTAGTRPLRCSSVAPGM
jgi:hypothetical protein